MECPACGEDRWGTAHEGRVRAGQGGHVDGLVWICLGCGLQRLAGAPLEYGGDDYRLAYNGTAEPEAVMAVQREVATSQVALVGDVDGRMVVDVGCGAGAFLDAIRRRARCTVGIEPHRAMHAHLLKHDINCFESVPEFLLKWRVPRPADVVTSFGVIEHVEDPLEHLRQAAEVVKPGGVFWLQTDNLEDVLMRTRAPGFAEHFYRTAHRWYFTQATLRRLFERAGFASFEVYTLHHYSFTDFLKWHAGLPKRVPYSGEADTIWKMAIGRAGMGDLITVRAQL